VSAVLEAQEPSARYLDAAQPALLRQFNLLATAPGGVTGLRELILTLAVHGKLAPQDARDEPASVVIERIGSRQAGRSQGKASNPIANTLSTEEEPPFFLPDGWQWARLGSVFTLQYGSALPEKTRVEGSIPVYGSNGRVGTHCAALVSYPSLVIGRKGSVGAVNVTSGPFWPIDTSYFVTPPHGVHLQFAYWLFRSLRLSKHDKATAIPGINRNDVYAELFALPPTAEQARIVARVDELMRLCDALEVQGRLEAEQHARLLGTLLGTLTDSSTPEELAANWQRVAAHFDLLLDRPEAVDALEQTILQLAVRGVLVPQEPSEEPGEVFLQRLHVECRRLRSQQRGKHEELRSPIESGPYELPSGWLWTAIEDLADVGTGTTPSRDNAAFFTGGTIPWVTSGETGQPLIRTTSQHVTEAALASTSLTLYPIGTLIVAMYGQGKTRGQVSELCLKATTNQACAAIVLMEKSASHRDFVKLVFEKSYDEIRDLSAGGAQPNLNVGKVKAARIPLPPLAEQARIVARVTELRRLCADLRQRLTAGQTTQSLLAEALVDQVA